VPLHREDGVNTSQRERFYRKKGHCMQTYCTQKWIRRTNEESTGTLARGDIFVLLSKRKR